MTGKQVLAAYNITKSVKKTAEKLGISEDVVHKWLVTYKVIDTPRSRRCAELRAIGLPIKDIADILKVSPSLVGKNLPYERGTYLSETKTISALRIKESRQRKAERIAAKDKTDMPQ